LIAFSSASIAGATVWFERLGDWQGGRNPANQPQLSLFAHL
jgi:hypothetical protein